MDPASLAPLTPRESGSFRTATFLAGLPLFRELDCDEIRRIASRLNLTQEHFSRIMHQLMKAGLIEISGREIRIPDVGRLRTHGAG